MKNHGFDLERGYDYIAGWADSWNQVEGSIPIVRRAIDVIGEAA
jgi:hypothetical protein